MPVSASVSASVPAFLSGLADRLEKNPNFSEAEGKKLAHECRNQAQLVSLISEVGNLPATNKTK